jgi:hypothetical protein
MLTFARDGCSQDAEQDQPKSIRKERESWIDISIAKRPVSLRVIHLRKTASYILEIDDADESTDSKDRLTGTEHV